jgi:hypothetical protein
MLGYKVIRRGKITAVHDIFIIGICSFVVLLNGAFLAHLEPNLQSYLVLFSPGVMLCVWYAMTIRIVKEAET